MKVCLVAHGYPPELIGGTEKSVQGLAHGLVGRGVDVLVVAGSMEFQGGFRTTRSVDTSGGAEIPVVRIHRADLYFDHWQKSVSARVIEAFREVLRAERPDLVHVHHWIRLSRDLVWACALEGIPAVATLHDLWTSCLVTFRVRPDTQEFCEAPMGIDPCLDCVAHLPPRTPWVARENLFLAFAERRADLVRELELARAVIVPTRAHARALATYLGVDAGEIELRIVPHGRDLELAPRSPRAAPRAPEPLVLGAWGHVHALKGVDLLIEALQRLPDPARCELHIAGAEPDADYAARVRASARGLRVRFHGPYDVSELFTHAVSDVHAMVSGTRAQESWGLILDEALALGLPLLLPRSGAFPERLAEGHGALFYEPRDAASLAQLLQRLLKDPDLVGRVRARLPEPAAFTPTVARHAAAVLEVYDEALRAGPPPRPAEEWWRARLQETQEEAWDASLSARSAEELGLA